ncbi:EGF domain-specific O-linked N-acetylglucosamine transferase [Tribolium castaneum]|uniref:EGF domain-specific O-linked N-acetylglucosamine transferase n=1 Tax=Tribolium castaneum TaxID=7070 RepID=D6WM60_TRICA|nr:PREDICTED: EGF domain-specific O-linked N-acetylglucosamine transferase [Tribolium castaneum]EFA03354.1 EGF domain-specific O-linked N-acetylglucosamine transferase-like Protein [Tribolium castaneum]|eukprot:XP_966996.1 PREDICTED: EGF domain-specific O-linked N-acetylglucosamine transferase [Tribolium castaneum]
MFAFFTLFLTAATVTYCDNFSSINLPDSHLPYYFTNFPKIREKCDKDPQCPYKTSLNSPKCWGYEYNCLESERFSAPRCPGDHKGWVKSKSDQINTFYTQADFGFVKQQLREMKLLCEPLFADDSSLECSEHLRFCRGRNLMINFTDLRTREDPIRYKMDVLKDGQIGGYCDFKQAALEEQTDHLSPLQSWAPEMRYFARLARRPIVEGDCDVVIEKPTFIMKIDATVNMYHHFCDFLNLYASIHLNSTQWDAFSTDVHVLIWETYTYRSAFGDTWEAFTDHPVWDLKTFRGETVCFKNVVFPLLPRMIFGLYYNTPIIYGCENSGLFQAFSQHILHRLKIPFHPRNNRKIRITLLARDTKYRRILNEDELVEALAKNHDYEVQKVVYNKDVPFKKQLEITRNSDVLIGVHGAGLTHLLFLPDWAAVFELYNCEDANCYFDLARLRGLKYVTWEKLDKLKSQEDGTHDGGAHAKFANYSFDVKEFLRLVAKAAKHVENHPDFKNLISKLDNEMDHDEL